MNKKGFTLIELLAVLVVLAILALISIPITIRIINNARENSYKRSIANYGRAVESYIGEYLSNHSMDYKDITYDMIKDDIKVNGNSVTCDGLSFEENGDIILNYCHTSNSKTYKYKNRQVKLQKYEYQIGDSISIHGMNFNVIASSPKEQDYVVALKTTPLTVDEVNLYGGVGTANNYVNRNTKTSVGEARDINGYGGVAFYSSDNCYHIDDQHYGVGCATHYNDSDVKHIIDNWKDDLFQDNDLVGIKISNYSGLNSHYQARLISGDELNFFCDGVYCMCSQYKWLCNSDYHYWTMDQSSWLSERSIGVGSDGKGYRFGDNVYSNLVTIRPVINVYKSAIEKSD